MNCLLVLSLAVLGASAAPCGLNVVSGLGCGNVVSGLGCGNVASGLGCGNVVSGLGCGNVVSELGCGNVASGLGCGNVVSGLGCGNVISGNVATQGCATALPGRTIFAQTPVIENPTAVFPAILPSTSVSQSCHCMKTVVRPQIRNEIITVPTIDRVVRVVTSPVVEVSSVNCGGNTRNFQVPTCGSFEGVSTGVIGGGYPTIVSGGYQGLNGGCQLGGVVNSGIVGTGCGCSVVA